ncbi:MAG TPA: IS1 family transposase, partial [Amoebophilaceae bacterium]|nr:IS1 family transposase [Amoebophilaceae bacterium]
SSQKHLVFDKNLRPRTVFTDKWSAYRGILPKRKHVVGKQYTQAIESMHATFRHYLCRFRRKTKGYSKSKRMVEITLALFTFSKSIF